MMVPREEPIPGGERNPEVHDDPLPDEPRHRLDGPLLLPEGVLFEGDSRPDERTETIETIETETGAEETEIVRVLPHEEEASTQEGPNPHTLSLPDFMALVTMTQTPVLFLASSPPQVKLQ